MKANDIFSSNFVILSAQLPELILVTLHHTYSFAIWSYVTFPKRNSRQNIKMIRPLDYFVDLYS